MNIITNAPARYFCDVRCGFFDYSAYIFSMIQRSCLSQIDNSLFPLPRMIYLVSLGMI